MTPAEAAAQRNPGHRPSWLPSARSGRVRLVLALSAAQIAAARTVLDGDARVEIVGTAQTASDAVEQVCRSLPHVVIVDAALAQQDEGRLLRTLRKRAPATSALALVTEAEGEQGLGALLAGARGLVDADADQRVLLTAIERVAAGRLVLEGEVAEQVLGRVRAQLASQVDARHRDAEAERTVEQALALDGFAIVVQPIVDLASGTPLGYEALSRFALDPPQSPDRVFAAAASIGRALELEIAAIDRALAVLAEIPAGCYLTINASPETVRSDALLQRLEAHPSVARIVLEITENAPIADYDAFKAALAPLRTRGLRLAIDDTGAGFASMRHILRLDPDIIKLDRSITELIDRDRPTRGLAAALAMFAFESGMNVIAEGIETRSQLAALQTLGVTAGQGYLLGRPAAPGDAVRA